MGLVLLIFIDFLMKNNTHVITMSKLARVSLCQQLEEMVGVREQVNSEKISHRVLGSPTDLDNTVLKLHQEFLTGYNQKLCQGTVSLSVVLGGVARLGIISRD